MIIFKNNNTTEPYERFRKEYNQAKSKDQANIEAICISSYNHDNEEVNSRFVNLKIVDNKKFIFFTNYKSPKSKEFQDHKQVAANIFWHSTNIQIRIKAIIKKTSKSFNNEYFRSREIHKNRLAISSNQSAVIPSYDLVISKYKKMENINLSACPNYWGGFYFIPYYFEFWEGHNSRLNKRDAFKLNNGKWNHQVLEP